MLSCGKRGGTHGDDPENAFFGRPAVPDQSGRIQECGHPGIFSHAVFGTVDQLAVLVVAACAGGLAGHYGISPFAAEETRAEVADGVWDVGQADDDGGEVVRGFGKGALEADVEDVEGAEGDAGVVDCD